MVDNSETLEYLGNKKYQPEPGIDNQGRKLFPYLPDKGLVKAVNLAIALERPLLIQGEPGCGKTLLARAVAYEFGQRYLNGKDEWPYFRWNITSRSQAQEGRYTYDALGKLRDAQMVNSDALSKYFQKDERQEIIKRLQDPEGYITWGALGEAFQVTAHRPIVLIDEIDKADIDFPNDLLAELEDPSFVITETQKLVRAKKQPIVFITSNSEKDLPEAFLRRCIFYYLTFPDRDRLQQIVEAHFPEDRRKKVFESAIAQFMEIREQTQGRSSRKQPSTSELIDWMRILASLPEQEAIQEIEELRKDSAQLGVLLKSRADLQQIFNDF